MRSMLQTVGRPRVGVRAIRAPRRMRRGAVSTLDYVLVLAVILPAVVFVFGAERSILRAAYEMICVLVSWPFL